MFCHNCGAKLPDNAKFCIECGAKTITDILVDLPSATVPSVGYLFITRTFNNYNSQLPVELYINGEREYYIVNGETIKVTLDEGTYTVSLQQNGFVVLERIVEIKANEQTTIEFEVNDQSILSQNALQLPYSGKSVNRHSPEPGSSFGRVCPRCGGPMLIQTVAESKKTGCGTIILYLILALTILGLFIVIPLALRKKTETVTYAVCQRCGYSQLISRR